MSNDTFDAATEPSPGPDPASLVATPSIALLVTGILNVLLALYLIVSGLNAVFMGDKVQEQIQQQMEQNPAFQDLQNQPGGGPRVQDIQTFMAVGAGVNIALGVLSLIVAGVIIMGALKMKRLQSYGLAMTSSILAMIPFLSCCCPVGLPVGIWSIMVLMKPEVKSAFH